MCGRFSFIANLTKVEEIHENVFKKEYLKTVGTQSKLKARCSHPNYITLKYIQLGDIVAKP